jgi:hypothetical protein
LEIPKGVIDIFKSKDRQCKRQMDKRTKSMYKTLNRKLKDSATRITLKTGMNSGAPEKGTVSVYLLKNITIYSNILLYKT